MLKEEGGLWVVSEISSIASVCLAQGQTVWIEPGGREPDIGCCRLGEELLRESLRQGVCSLLGKLGLQLWSRWCGRKGGHEAITLVETF